MENPADYLYIALQITLGEEGKRNAVTRIWKVYGKGIHYFISRSFPGDHDRRDDCFQETMVKVYRGLDTFTVGRPLKPWIYRIARNCCMDELRKRGEESLDGLSDAPDRESHDDAFMRDELMCAIDASIGLLDADNARIAYLRFYEGMKFREIAAVMEMNEKTVKSRVDAIKKRLRAELKEWL